MYRPTYEPPFLSSQLIQVYSSLNRLKKEQQKSYIDLKNRKLDIHEKKIWEAPELKRQKLEIKRKTLELKLTPVPTVDKVDEMILQDTLQVSLAEHKSQEEHEARENMELVNKHLASVEIEKMVEGP
ncbi:hypothetical protein Tco_0614910 [Tanacetum coccineum]